MASILGVETLQHTNGTTAATIDSSGNITASGYVKSELPHFNVRRVGTMGGINGVIQFNEVVINSGNHYDTTNHYFKAPVTGLYCFMLNAFSCLSNGNGATGTIRVAFQTSSDASTWTTIRETQGYSASAMYIPVNPSFIIEMTANEYIRVNVTNLYLYQTTPAAGFEPNFSGYLIG